MKKLVITFGLISGAIICVLMALSLSLIKDHNFEGGELIGYTSMIIAFSMIFVAIKSYRDKQLQGVITFGRAFQIGLYITLVASVLYVVWWMVYSETVYTTFTDDYIRSTIDQMISEGATEAAIAEKRAEMAEFKELYANPVFKVMMTFVEIFPVGLIVSLVSAAILRKKDVLPA